MQKLTEEYVKSISRKDILSLDIATTTGYYNIYEHGVVKFPATDKAPKYLGKDYAQHKAFRKWLLDMITKHHVKAIAAEDVIYGHFVDFRKLCEFRGIALEVCETLNIPIILFKPSDVKKFATGSGNANKQQMIEACAKRWHIDAVDDNEADAAHIFFYFCNRYKL